MAAHAPVHSLVQHSGGEQQGHRRHIVGQRQLQQDGVAELGGIAGQLRGDGGPSDGEGKLRMAEVWAGGRRVWMLRVDC